MRCLLIVFLYTTFSVFASAAEALTIRINAGGGDYIDGSGNLWSADTGFNTGNTGEWGSDVTTSGTSEPELYRTERWLSESSANLEYNITVPNGIYLVNLHYADHVYDTAGSRVTNVEAEGQPVLTNLDIAGEVGINAALIKSFTTTVQDGQLTITFQRVTDNPNVMAIEVVQQSTSTENAVVNDSQNTADINGYTAQYEEDIGTPPACDAVISSASDSDWNKLNDTSYRVICLGPADYTSRGQIVLTQSGSDGNERWLRYYDPNDAGDDPWDQDPSKRAILNRLHFDGASHWIIHRITIDGEGSSAVLNTYSNNADYNVLDHILVEDGKNHLIQYGDGNEYDTVQNSVIRDCTPVVGLDNSGVANVNSQNNKIINNEIYDCQKAVYISEHNAEGTIIENNDMYLEPEDMYTDCKGNFNSTGPCAAAEAIMATKNGGTALNPVLIIHNRIWGARRADTSVCCNGGGQGDAMAIQGKDAQADPTRTGAKFTLIQNNIVMDSQHGIEHYWGGVRNNSIIGNILYKIHRYYTGKDNVQSYAFSTQSGYGTYSEWYFNTVVDSDAWVIFEGAVSNDMRCNVIINSGGPSGTPGSGTQVEYNAFYNTPLLSTGSGENDIVRNNAGDSLSTEFCFNRKLLTAPEQICIPYVQPTEQSPHLMACDSEIGSRKGIGINDNLF